MPRVSGHAEQPVLRFYGEGQTGAAAVEKCNRQRPFRKASRIRVVLLLPPAHGKLREKADRTGEFAEISPRFADK